MPFLENVLRGRNVPRERLLAVAEHYYHFGGKSPINDQNRALIAALRRTSPIPIYWGNRNWHPFLADTLRQMKADGVERALAFFTSALQFVFRLPAVSGRHRARASRSRAGRPRNRQAAAVLQPPRLY